MTNLIKMIVISCTVFATIACNEETERFENIKKLRAFGVAADPVSSSPSTLTEPHNVTLTIYAALPKGKTVTASPFIDDGSKYALPLAISLVPGSEVYEDHPAFQIFSVKASAVIPTQELLVFSPDLPFIRLRYGIKLVSESEEENIVGNVLVYQAGAKELGWTAPNVTINNPVAGSSVSGKQNISLTIDSTNEENFRVSWLVSDGKMKNRRGIKTEWEPGSAGEYTMLASIRGLKSGAFQYKIVDFKVE